MADFVPTLEDLEERASKLIRSISDQPMSYESVRLFESHLLEMCDIASSEGWVSYKARRRARRDWVSWLIELILSTRLEELHYSYYLLREGADTMELKNLERSLNQLFLSLGQNDLFVAKIRIPTVKRMKWNIKFDPLADLRKSIEIHGSSEAIASNILREFHYLKFRTKAVVLMFVARLYFKRIGFKTVKQLGGDSNMGRNVQNLFKLVSGHLMPKIVSSSKETGTFHTINLGDFFHPNLAKIVSKLFKERRYVGTAKLIKVAAGVCFWRDSRFDPEHDNPIEFLRQTIAISIAWGLTYPLVDDVLDDSKVQNQTKELTRDVVRSFVDSDWKRLNYFNEQRNIDLAECFNVLSQQLNGDELSHFQNWVSLLLDVHFRDFQRDLKNSENISYQNVVVDASVKAALVRIATKAVAGYKISEDQISKFLWQGLFNQLSDDIADVREDFAENRVTPVTLNLIRPEKDSPEKLYFLMVLNRLEKSGRLNQQTAVYALLNTVRILIEERGPNNYTSKALAELLADFDHLKEMIEFFPYLEIDTILFGMFDTFVSNFHSR